jgi:hypothetical protein
MVVRDPDPLATAPGPNSEAWTSIFRDDEITPAKRKKFLRQEAYGKQIKACQSLV